MGDDTVSRGPLETHSLQPLRPEARVMLGWQNHFFVARGQRRREPQVERGGLKKCSDGRIDQFRSAYPQAGGEVPWLAASLSMCTDRFSGHGFYEFVRSCLKYGF